jgi:hypothetical protein
MLLKEWTDEFFMLFIKFITSWLGILEKVYKISLYRINSVEFEM